MLILLPYDAALWRALMAEEVLLLMCLALGYALMRLLTWMEGRSRV